MVSHRHVFWTIWLQLHILDWDQAAGWYGVQEVLVSKSHAVGPAGTKIVHTDRPVWTRTKRCGFSVDFLCMLTFLNSTLFHTGGASMKSKAMKILYFFDTHYLYKLRLFLHYFFRPYTYSFARWVCRYTLRICECVLLKNFDMKAFYGYFNRDFLFWSFTHCLKGIASILYNYS